MTSLGLAVLVIVAVGGLLWLVRGSGADRPPGRAVDPDLEDAEEEVRDLDAFLTPDEAEDELPDWGPGAPRQ